MASEVLKSLIEKNDLDGVDQYISNGGSVNGTYNVRGDTPLFLAIYARNHGKTEFFYKLSSAEDNKITHEVEKIILHLIGAGADVHARTGYGYTPLMKALEFRLNNKIIVEFLNARSDVNAKGRFKRTPLSWAIINDYDKELIYNMIKKGANVNHVDDNGNTPLLHALGHPDRYNITDVLLDAGANINSGNCWRMMMDNMDCHRSCEEGACENKQIIDFLVNKGLDLTIRSTCGYNKTVIHEVKCNYLISMAIKCGVSVDSKDTKGRTPLMCTMYRSGSFDKVKSLLIKFNANPNNVDDELKSVLHHAVYSSCSKISELVLYRGRDIFARDIFSKTPFDLLSNDIMLIMLVYSSDNPRGISFIKYYLLYVDENNLCEYFRRQDSGITQEELESFFKFECMKLELSKMKQMFIKDGLTFYDFCRLKRFYRSKPIDMSLDELNYNIDQIQEMFPIYHDFIITRIKDNLIKNNKRHLLNSLEGIIIRPLPIDENDPYLNYDCKRLIARYFNRKQLITLFQASILE